MFIFETGYLFTFLLWRKAARKQWQIVCEQRMMSSLVTLFLQSSLAMITPALVKSNTCLYYEAIVHVNTGLEEIQYLII